MNTNYDTICRHFRDNKIAFEAHDSEHAIAADFGLKNISAQLAVLAPPDEPFLSLTLMLPVTVPSGRRAAIAELLHRLNWNLATGHFELDWDNGLVRLAYAIPLADEGCTVAEDSFRRWLLLACTTLDGLCPAILKVAFSSAAPAHAAEHAEAEMQAYLKSITGET
jgi:hypothetical protein